MTDLQKKLEDLHAEVAQALLNRIQGDEASASDFSNAIKFLKDNGMDISNIHPGDPLAELVDSLPFSEEEKQSLHGTLEGQ